MFPKPQRNYSLFIIDHSLIQRATFQRSRKKRMEIWMHSNSDFAKLWGDALRNGRIIRKKNGGRGAEQAGVAPNCCNKMHTIMKKMKRFWKKMDFCEITSREYFTHFSCVWGVEGWIFAMHSLTVQQTIQCDDIATNEIPPDSFGKVKTSQIRYIKTVQCS